MGTLPELPATPTAQQPGRAPSPQDGQLPGNNKGQAKVSPLRAAIRSLAAGRRMVSFTAAFPSGAIVVVNWERALYHVGADQTAIRYPVAIGSMTEAWTGVEFVTDKKVNPPWHPVVELGKEIKQPVPGGDPTNPLGARALYLGRTLWRIHGTPASNTIGQAVSNGCIRMHNEHVVELYDNVPLGAEVYVVERLSDAPPSRRGRKLIEQSASASTLPGTPLPRLQATR